MGFQVVYVMAYVPDQPIQPPGGGNPPGIWGGGNEPWPTPPIAQPPGGWGGGGGGGNPPGIWGPNDPRPTPPIYLPPSGGGGGGGNPPGIWGGGNVPMPTPPIYLPGGGGGSPGTPTHPIVIPPDAIAPGVPTHPIYLPVYPAHPIVIPPGSLGPGIPTHPIYLPGEPTHPIVIPPDAVAPGVPSHPIVLPPYPDNSLPGNQPGLWPDKPPYVDIGLPGNQPGIWPGLPPYIDIGGPGPQPGPEHPIVLPPPTPPMGGQPEHPIYYPPVIWPDPPTGYPSIDPDQLPQHPEQPDMNRGLWTWLQQGETMVRAFAVPTTYVSNDLPGYGAGKPPTSGLPGDWVIGLFNRGPLWCWIPSPDSGGSEPHPDNTLPGAQQAGSKNKS